MRHSRNQLAHLLGYPDVNYLNQIVKGHGAFGPKTAARFEDKLKLGEGWMDTPHPALWAELGEDKVDMEEVIADILEGMSTKDLATILDMSLSRLKSSPGS